jgi:ribosomal protein S18 acetylase RimI-like enzyme
MKSIFTLKKPDPSDYETLYQFALETPELKVSANDVFMDKEEFLYELTRGDAVAFIASNDTEIIGFVLGSISTDPSSVKAATVVYIVVKPNYQGNGIGHALLQACEQAFREHNVVDVHTWANTHSPVVQLMEKNGFAKGHEYIWMDKKL